MSDVAFPFALFGAAGIWPFCLDSVSLPRFSRAKHDVWFCDGIQCVVLLSRVFPVTSGSWNGGTKLESEALR